MKINNADNFVHIIAKLLKALGYSDVKETGGDSGIDITASMDGKSYCFRCLYDIEAISEKKMRVLADAYKSSRYDKAVFVTNSSFISGAKKLGEQEGILMWDRNTIDRMAIGISENIEDKVVEPKKHTGLIVTIVAVVVIAIVAVLVFFKLIN